MAVHAAVALTIVLSPAIAEVPVSQTWNEEHGELLRQIGRLKRSDENRRERLHAETLDRQALILPEDTDPLDVVLRRTAALIEYYRQRGQLSLPRLSEFETRLSKLYAFGLRKEARVIFHFGLAYEFINGISYFCWVESIVYEICLAGAASFAFFSQSCKMRVNIGSPV